MNHRGTLALLVLFFAGLVGLWWADRSGVPDREARRRAEPRVLPALLNTRPDEVRRVEIAGGPEPIVFERRGTNRWQMAAPADVAADPSMVETLALNLKGLARIPDAGTLHDDPKDYGLATPSRVIRLYGADPTRPIAGLEVGSVSHGRRFVRAEFLRKKHRPRHRSHAAGDARGPAVELAIDEIRQPHEEQSDRRDHHQTVADARPRHLFPPRPIKREQHQSDDAAVAGHAALPDAEKIQRMRQHLAPAVEKRPAQPPADHHAKNRRPGDEIADLRHR